MLANLMGRQKEEMEQGKNKKANKHLCLDASECIDIQAEQTLIPKFETF